MQILCQNLLQIRQKSTAYLTHFIDFYLNAFQQKEGIAKKGWWLLLSIDVTNKSVHCDIYAWHIGPASQPWYQLNLSRTMHPKIDLILQMIGCWSSLIKILVSYHFCNPSLKHVGLPTQCPNLLERMGCLRSLASCFVILFTQDKHPWKSTWS